MNSVRSTQPREGDHQGVAGSVSSAPVRAAATADLLASQRQAYILDRVRADGQVRVADLASELGVSDMTIRRDLQSLHARNLLQKVHGGATAVPDSALFEPGFPAKSVLQEQEK